MFQSPVEKNAQKADLDMDVVDQDALGRWDGLSSRDAASRDAAMESIQLELMRRVEAMGPAPASGPLSPASLGPLHRVLNGILAHLLMLSTRCPFQDIRERCGWLLQTAQVRRYIPPVRK